MPLFRGRRQATEDVEPPAPPPAPAVSEVDDQPTLRSADDLIKFEHWLAERRDRDDAVGLVARQWNDPSVAWQEPENRRALQETILRFLANDALDG